MKKLQGKMLRRISPFMAILLGLLVGAIVIILSGNNPLEAYRYLFEGSIKGIFTGNFKRVGDVLLQMTPLILTGLSVAFAFKTGLFNIGVSGQMLFGGFLAVFVGVHLDLPRPLFLVVTITVGALGGSFLAILPGLLKAKYRVHEVVTSIMMNYIALHLVKWLIGKYIPGIYETQSASVKATALLNSKFLSNAFNGSYVNLGIFIATMAVFLVWFILRKTTIGFEAKAVGYNQDASEYAGISVDKNIIRSMMIAGALAGLAGVVYYTSGSGLIQVGILPSLGFDGIAVALLGMSNPIGVVLSSLLFGFMRVGGYYLVSWTNIQNELVDVIIATIIYFSATSLVIEQLLIKLLNKRKGDA